MFADGDVDFLAGLGDFFTEPLVLALQVVGVHVEHLAEERAVAGVGLLAKLVERLLDLVGEVEQKLSLPDRLSLDPVNSPRSFDEATSLASSYYPPNPSGTMGPTVLLVHDFGRSRKDFDDPIGELRGEGLAVHLQNLGFAVLSLDLRGQGQNARRAITANDRELMVQDLQAAYQFLVDRNNRGELNLSKFGVLGVGEGANLVASWAFQPGSAMTIDDRPSDINAMVLVSPKPIGHGYRLDQILGPLGARFPVLLMAGEKDRASGEAAKAAAGPLARSRLNKIEVFPSALHGFTLLRLEPKVTGNIVRFLETTLKNRVAEYEPRYNLNPIAYFDIRTRKNGTRGGEAPKADAKAQPKADAKAQPKAEAR